MKFYNLYTPNTAEPPVDSMLRAVEEMVGFLPNVFAVMGDAPPVLRAFIELNAQFAACSLTTTEREVVQLAASVENGSSYCVSGHTAFASESDVPHDAVNAIRASDMVSDGRLEALRSFTQAVVAKRGIDCREDLDRFMAAGYAPRHAREVVLGICVKMFSNLFSGLHEIPLDDAFVPHAWQPRVAQRG